MRYVATGRVHPERADIFFGPIEWQFPQQGRIVATCEASQLTVLLELESVDGFVTAHITAEQFAHLAVGALGFALGTGYSVELIQVTENDGTPHVFGVRPTAIDSHDTLGFDPHIPIFNRALQLANQDLFFRLALRDYLRAMTDPIDCPTYCYRAIESIKAAFVLETGIDSWNEMHTRLGTDKATIESTVKRFADPIRHGNWIKALSTNAEDRWKMLKLTRDVLSGYLDRALPGGLQTGEPFPGAT